MTQESPYQQGNPYQQPVPSYPRGQAARKTLQRNIPGIVALVFSLLSPVLLFFPYVRYLGALLLVAALVLGVVALCREGRSKWEGFMGTMIAAAALTTHIFLVVFFQFVFI